MSDTKAEYVNTLTENAKKYLEQNFTRIASGQSNLTRGELMTVVDSAVDGSLKIRSVWQTFPDKDKEKFPDLMQQDEMLRNIRNQTGLYEEGAMKLLLSNTLVDGISKLPSIYRKAILGSDSEQTIWNFVITPFMAEDSLHYKPDPQGRPHDDPQVVHERQQLLIAFAKSRE